MMPDGIRESSNDAGQEGQSASKAVRLTATQRHYLLKLLICAQMHDEWSLLDESDGLKQYGAPFVDGAGEIPASVGQQSDIYAEHTGRPVLLLHMFHVHLRRFPGLYEADKGFWQKGILPFFEAVADAHFSNSVERAEYTNRKMLNIIATRYLSTFLSRGVGVRGPGEEKGPGAGQGASNGDVWGKGKQWGRGTVKRGLDQPLRPGADDVQKIDGLFGTSDDTAKVLWDTGAANTQRVKSDWSAWKESIIETENGLDETLSQLQTKFMKNLPDRYRNAAEWVRRHVAFVAWSIFVKYPGGDEIFRTIKTIHTLFPYWGAKQLLKIANAQKMIKAIVDLVLARPLGAIDSLGQRIFFTILQSEIGKIESTLLTPLRKAIDDKDLCKALDSYVSTRSSEDRSRLMKLAKEKGNESDFLLVVLREYGFERAGEAEKWQKAYVDSILLKNVDWAYPAECRKARSLEEPPAAVAQQLSAISKDARKFAQCKLYLREALRKRDRVKVLSIGSGPLVPTVIRQSLEIVFYKLLYDIALASNLSARLQDWQNFIDDLIRVKQQKRDSLEDYVALTARHESQLYMFVHEIRDAVKPVFDWCQTALDFMALSTTDPWHPSNRSAKRLEVNLDRLLEKASADVDVDQIVKELQSVEQFAKWDKIKTEVAMRKEYALIHDDAVTNVTICQWKRLGRQKGLQSDDERVEPSEATRERMSDLDGLMTELLKEAGVEADRGQIDLDGARGTDAGQIPWAFYTPDDPFFQRFADRIRDSDTLGARSYHVDGVHVRAPIASSVRALLPAFRAELAQCLPDWWSDSRKKEQ